MRLDADDARARFSSAAVARLATIAAGGAPHAVPICFVALGDVVYSAVDDKPKSRVELRRLDNIAAHPDVAVLVDHYAEDWSRLWWVRADGTARLVADDTERDRAVDALRAKYAQYATHALDGALIAVDVSRWSGWAASGTRPAR